MSVNRGSVQYLMEIGIFSPAQVLCKLNVIHVMLPFTTVKFKNMSDVQNTESLKISLCLTM